MAITAPPSVFDQILDPAHRADPYPLYAELRRTPVARQTDGTWIVSGYAEIVALLHDPRISSEQHDLPAGAAASPLPPAFLQLDPPEHDRLRRIVTRHYGPPHTPGRVDAMIPDLRRVVSGLVDGLDGSTEVDLVDQVAYPFPVTVICDLLGVPREDEPRFHPWSEALISALDPGSGDQAERQRRRVSAMTEMGQYFAGLIHAHRQAPGSDLLSALATDDSPEGRLTDPQLLTTAFLLLNAGHETTVNLIANGMLTLLRHPDVLARLRREPELVIHLVEELLRYEPPVQFLPNRSALDDIEIGGTTIPAGSPVTLVLAAGSRDPAHVRDPDRFDPDRFDPDRFGLARDTDQHLGFGGGPHYCFGAPLARLETQIALTELSRRLVDPRLVVDPPPYRANPVLRGPQHLRVAIGGVLPAGG
ncbi:cytochrome P450 [Actinomycetospora sp. TBRC 11914]|uniref:cytochrome P450 n=1 Tax=Actinomycetospora sp. TBRC 11914 TaxID=2729387 RepID=UPI00145E4BE9|nr:cytochrome P450 [Actinomycetospora sp. TBRC 11914]NMO90796.1 cytochrome P450 [Actinomycetospora sp. TBRC 11914]